MATYRRRRPQSAGAAALILSAALVLGACGGDGGSDGGGGNADAGDGTVDFPATWTYNGIEWSITGAEVETDERDDENLVMDVRTTNRLPGEVDGFDVGKATRLSGVWLDVTIARGDSFGIPDITEGEATEGTWTFPVDEEPDLADLTVVMQHEDRTPAVVPLDGETFDLPQPIPAEIDADDVVATGVSCGGSWGVNELSEFEAEVGWVDHLGVRAQRDHRLLAVSMKFLETDGTLDLGCGFDWVVGDGLFYIEADGDETYPARAWPAADYGENDSGTETVLFEVPRDAGEIVLVIDGLEDDGETPETLRFPITYDELPACCEE